MTKKSVTLFGRSLVSLRRVCPCLEVVDMIRKCVPLFGRSCISLRRM